MPYLLRVVALTTLLLLASRSAAAQRNMHLRITLGLIETQHQVSNRGNAWYPEVELSRTFLRSEAAALEVGGGLYWGFWAEDADDQPVCADCFYYDYATHAAGARVVVTPTALPLPMLLSGGIARHFLAADYVGGTGVHGRPGTDFRDAYTAAEGGVHVMLPISDGLEVVGGVQGYAPLADEDAPYKPRMAFHVGVSFAR